MSLLGGITRSQYVKTRGSVVGLSRVNKLFLSLCVCVAPLAWAGEPSLCASEETNLFTCSIGKKLVSVCASKDLAATSGYVQYRFGRSGQPPELVYPTQKDHPASHFSWGFTGYAKGSLENLHFSQSGYIYTVYREANAFDVNGAGVRVKTPDGSSRRLPCSEESPESHLYELGALGLRVLPEESLVSVSNFETWAAESPNADLLQGSRTHDFTLVMRALNSGADPNFHGPNDLGALGAVADLRLQAESDKRVREFDEETDRLVALLLSRGTSPIVSMTNGATPVESLAIRSVPSRTLRTLLDAGWPNDPQYRLHVGALTGDATLVKESLAHGANPNTPFRNSRVILSAITKASTSANKGMETEQQQALSAMDALLKGGATLDEGTPRSGGGDIVMVYSYWGASENITPVLDLLIRYASPTAKENALYWLRATSANTHPKRQANLAWLLGRLELP
jgi:hypothetical protein